MMKMTDIEFIKLLKDKKVVDSFQFYSSCRYKLAIAETSYNALNNLVIEYFEAESKEVKSVFEDAFKTGVGSYNAKQDAISFFGVDISLPMALDKLVMEIMGLLHNFFDIFAQWINSSLLGEKALPIKKVTLLNVIKEIANYPEYSGQFISNFQDIPNTSEYEYIADFNNISKHRHQIYTRNKFNILSLQGSVDIPGFEKDGRVQVKKETLSTALTCLNFCLNMLQASRTYIEHYYSASDCNYTEHRIYNPKTYLLFDSEEKYSLYKPSVHYHYIEVNPSDILPEYQIMLVSDRAEREHEEEKSLELYNSVYQIIMLRNIADDKIVGVLEPYDTELFSLNDERIIMYRRYIPNLSEEYYHRKMTESMCGGTFNYYPFLSDATSTIIKSEI